MSTPKDLKLPFFREEKSMAKTKTSKKLKNSSGDDFPLVKLKPGVKTTSWHPAKEMADPAKVIKALFDSLLDGDTEAFKEILQAHLEARNISKLAKESGISRRTIYAALSKGGNPSLDTIAKLVHQAFSKVS
jgi:probable addiction module antidote protein